MAQVERYKSAMHRGGLSRPIALALRDGLVDRQRSVFDYGCGRGGDVERLRRIEIAVSGWDPTFFPSTPKRAADVVNIGYVINVIEDPAERLAALREAWSLTRRVLVVAARLEWEARFLNGQIYADGVVTSKGTFQKLFRQDELADFTEAALASKPIAAAPGIFYVFRDSGEAQDFLARRYRGRAVALSPNRTEELYELHRGLADELCAFVGKRGRLPRESEIDCAKGLVVAFGSIQRAFAVVRRVVGNEQWEHVAELRRRDLLVFLALSRFRGRLSMSQLPEDVQFDIRDLFGSHKTATEKADHLLFAAGDSGVVDASARAATVGKLTQEALYVHLSALSYLPPVLRVYEGCARMLTGTVDDANLLKLHRQKAQVSYLSYPAFDSEPHPALATVVIARLGKLEIDFRDFRSSPNPPILHRKECFVAEEFDLRDRFQRLTTQEERAGLLGNGQSIGTRREWEEFLQASGYRLVGHRLCRDKATDLIRPI